MKKMFESQLGRFLAVGLLTVIVDFTTYRLLLWTTDAVEASKAVGFVCGTVFAFFANRAWTFGDLEHRAGSWWRFTALYATTFVANVGINSAVLSALDGVGQRVSIAFLLATATSATLNFLGMKLFVFREKKLVTTA